MLEPISESAAAAGERWKEGGLPSELQCALEAWSLRIGCPLAIFDDQLLLVEHSAHVGEIDTVRQQSILSRSAIDAIRALVPSLGLAERSGPIRVPLPAELQMQPRIVAPLDHVGTFIGSLWLSDPDGTYGQENWEQLRAAADELGDLLYDHLSGVPNLRLGGQRESGRRLRELLDATDAQRANAWQRLGAATRRPNDACLTILATGTSPGTNPSSLKTEFRHRRLVEPLLALETPEYAIWGVLAPPSSIETAVADVVEAIRGSRPPVAPPAVGVAPTLSWGCDVAAARRQAEDALEVAGLLPELELVAHWTRLGMFMLVVSLERQQPNLWRHFIELEALIEHGDDVLLRTLESYLDNGGDVQLTTEQMCVHRATIYYRLNKADLIVGRSLRKGDVRTLLHLALKSHRLRLARSTRATTGL